MIPKNILDYAKGVSQLKKDTGIDLLSFDWSEPMLETENGCVYFLLWDKENEEYVVYPESRQDKNCEETYGKKKMEEIKEIDDRYKTLESYCCKCGCEVDLREVCLIEDTGEPICDICR